MPLSAEERTRFIEILVDNIPATTFADVVVQQRLVKDFESVRKETSQDPTEARRDIATRVVEEYDAAGKVWQFAKGLYKRSYLDDQLGPLLAPFTVRPVSEETDAVRQAALALRANTMSNRKLRIFLGEAEVRVCLVVAMNDEPTADAPYRAGTGFLVGPDVVLTAYHTLVDHIEHGAQKVPPPGRCWAIFDYVEGDPFTRIDDLPPEAEKVPFADQWLVVSKELMPLDGRFRRPTREQLELLPARLDFAMVRLAEAIGMQVAPESGTRRSWVDLPKAPVSLKDQDRIIIPQHPNGWPLRADFGRFSELDSKLDDSETRLRYDTETDKGTSGAPCFNQSFMLVGMHNAEFRPDGVSVMKNQAIRIDRIAAALAAPGPAPSVAAPLADFATIAPRGSDIGIILGRRTLRDWFIRAQNPITTSSKDRVYAAAISPVDAGRKGFGRRFTLEMLKKVGLRASQPIVQLGADDNPLPDTVTDIVQTVAFQLGIEQRIMNTLPPRPASELPAGSPNADKVRRWASEDLPLWCDRVLAGLRDSPRRAAGATAAPMNEAEPLSRWPIAWVAVSNLLGARMSEEVRDFFAGMIGGKVAEASMPQQLRRLRWLFVGYVPDFLPADHITAEDLDPTRIGLTEVTDAMRLYAFERNVALEDLDVELATLMFEIATDPANGNTAAADPERRLVYLQTLFHKIWENVMKRRGRP